jgi:hypothetical protein
MIKMFKIDLYHNFELLPTTTADRSFAHSPTRPFALSPNEFILREPPCPLSVPLCNVFDFLILVFPLSRFLLFFEH